MALDLSKVDPQACLQRLNTSVSKSPTELVPVRPVLEFNIVDSRFVEETNVLSGLDQRPNLMELTPSEFESLITNLFQKMGLEARQTQASYFIEMRFCIFRIPLLVFGLRNFSHKTCVSTRRA